MDSIVVKMTCEGQQPEYQTDGAAGMDLRARLDAPVVLAAGKRELIPTGLRMQLPAGYEAQVRARSGLAAKYGIGLVNGIGTIDSDYRGEIKVCLINFGEEEFIIRDGDRIAQLVFARYARVDIEPVFRLSGTERGEGGFGHTGSC